MIRAASRPRASAAERSPSQAADGSEVVVRSSRPEAGASPAGLEGRRPAGTPTFWRRAWTCAYSGPDRVRASSRIATTPSRQPVWAMTRPPPRRRAGAEQGPEAAGQGHQINGPDRLRRRQAARDEPVREMPPVPLERAPPSSSRIRTTEVVS